MRIIEQLVYKIQGDNSEFDRSIDKSETKVSKFGSVADKMFAGVTVAAIGMAIKKMGDMVISSATALDRVDKLSQKIGLSREAFQEWDYIIGQSGASVEGLQMSLKTLSGAADEASKGNKQYKDSFDKLGVSVTDTNGQMKDQEALFSEVFSALADMENQTERTALASDLLGRAATELAPTLNTSKEDIEGLRQEAHDLGLVYSDELVDAGVVLGDNIDRLKKSFGALKTKALAPIIGLAVTFTDKILGQDSASKRLTTSTNNLASATDAYKTITSQLKNPIDNLTESEKALLEIQQKRAEIKLNQAIIELGKNYADTQRKISNLKDDEEKYQGTIEQSLAIINKYTPEQREEIKNYQQQGRAVTDMLLNKRELLTAEEDLEKAQINLLSTQEKLIDENDNFNASITQIAQGVIDQQVELSTLANINSDFAETVRLRAEAMEAERKATEDAAEAFKAYENATSEEISIAIKQLGLEEKTLANGKLIEMLQKKKIELATEAAKAAADEAGKEKARNEIIEAGNKAMELAEQYALALGSSYDLNAEKASILETTIKALIDSGLTAEDKAVADLTAQLKALGTTTEEVTDASVAAYAEIEKSRMSDKEKAFKAIQDQADAYLKAGVAKADVDKWQSEQIQKYQDEETKTRTDAYKLLESYSLSAKEKAIANIQAQADKFLEAGVSEVDVEKWKTNELEKLQEEQTKKAKEEAGKVRKAWEDATFSMLGSVTSIWSSINQVQANQNKEEIQRIEEQNAIAIQAAKDRGASEEEVTALEESLQADLNDAKNKYAQEEAKRNKAVSTLSVILDTAKAIMQIWADPLIAPWGKGLWTGLAAGAGAAQIAAINSAPVPSYDVGSIRIPETQTATVHKNEMILTAPQAEQARREGITIAPNKTSGNSVNLVIYLDGKEIARNTIDNLNSGSVGTIKARVVK